jgi:hypothetical protein
MIYKIKSSIDPSKQKLDNVARYDQNISNLYV